METNQAFSTIIKFVEDSGGGDVPGGGGGGAGADSWVSSNAVASSATSDALMVPLMILFAALVVVGAVVLLSRKKAAADNTTCGYFANNLIGGKHFTKIIVAIIAIAMACFIALPVGTAVADNDVNAEVSPNITAKVNMDTGVVTFENGYLQNKGSDRAVGIETFKAEGAGQGTNLTFAVKTNTSTVYSGTIDGAEHNCDGSSLALKSSTTPLYYTLEGDASATKALIGQEMTLSTGVSNMSELSGITKDNAGNPISGVAVKFAQGSPAREYNATSGTDGAFSVQVFAGCTGTMTFTKEGETFSDIVFDGTTKKTDDNIDLGEIKPASNEPGCYFINSETNGEEYVSWGDACNATKNYWQKYCYGLGNYVKGRPGAWQKDYGQMPTSTNVSPYSFYESSTLKRLILPEGVVSVDTYSLAYNNVLEEISFPSSLNSIDDSCCQYCTNLKKVNFSKNTKLCDYAFWNCYSLSEVNFGGTKEECLARWNEFAASLLGTNVSKVTCTNGDVSFSTVNVTFCSKDGRQITENSTIPVVYGDKVPFYNYSDSELGKVTAWWYYRNGEWKQWDFDTPVTTNLALFPVFEQCSVLFLYDGDTMGDSYSVDYNSTMQEDIPTPEEKEGYNFTGWKHIENNEAFDKTKPIVSDQTMYPSWDKVKVSLYESTSKYDEGEPYSSQDIEWGTKYTKPADPTLEGKEFKGWIVKAGQNASLKDTYDFDSEVFYDISLIAVWQPLKVNITYKYYNEASEETIFTTQEYDFNATITIPEDKPTAPEDYVFLYWEDDELQNEFKSGVPATADCVVWAKNGPASVEVNFYLDEDWTLYQTKNVESGETVQVDDPTEVGKTFLYWKYNDGSRWDPEEPIYDDENLIAVWLQEKVTVSYRADLWSEEPLKPSQTVGFGTKIDDPGTPEVPSGKTFAGWAYAEDCAPTIFVFWNFTEDKLVKDIKLYPMWRDAATGELIIPGVNDAKYKSDSTNATSVFAPGNEAAAPSEQAAPAEEVTSGSTTGDSESAAQEPAPAESDEPQEYTEG